MKPYTTFSTRKTPQSEAIPGQKMIKNNAGGYVYQLGDFKAFERFLILGSEGGSYYVGERKLTKENALRTMAVIASEGARAVEHIVRISDEGRAPKNDPALFALALAASADDPRTRALALAALPKVARIPTHLFHFITYVRQFRGIGRGLRTALAKWYNDKDIGQLAYQSVKFQSRDGWSNADVLRLAHPKTEDPARNAIYRWIVDGVGEVRKRDLPIPQIVAGFEIAKDAPVRELAQLIRDYNLSREMIPTEQLTKPEIQEALLERMPPEAMLRNLGNLSKSGLLKPFSDASKLVVAKLQNVEALHKARIHPLQVLVAMRVYGSGRGVKGDGTWLPVPAVVNALDDAFYECFKNIEPTGKRLLFGVDISGSMGSAIGNLPITCAEGATAMALACAKTEKDYYIHGFSTTFKDLGITAKMTLGEALRKTTNQNFGGTDCSLPMVWALKEKINVDGFIVITDSETWAGRIQPSQALRLYREQMGLNAKEVVIGMTATRFTIADPNDPGTLDVVGFDTATPQVVSEFIR